MWLTQQLAWDLQSATHTHCLSFPIVIFEKIHWFAGLLSSANADGVQLPEGQGAREGRGRQPPGELMGHLQHGKEPMEKRGPVS